MVASDHNDACNNFNSKGSEQILSYSNDILLKIFYYNTEACGIGVQALFMVGIIQSDFHWKTNKQLLNICLGETEGEEEEP